LALSSFLADFYSPELNFLDISSRPSELAQIFKELSRDLLPQLNALMLSTNQLRELPGELLALTNLNMLFLAENRLRCIEGLEKLRNLKTLNLDSNEVWVWFVTVDVKQC
jgi:Leucine-rich repeat (LRR) protein